MAHAFYSVLYGKNPSGLPARITGRTTGEKNYAGGLQRERREAVPTSGIRNGHRMEWRRHPAGGAFCPKVNRGRELGLRISRIQLDLLGFTWRRLEGVRSGTTATQPGREQSGGGAVQGSSRARSDGQGGKEPAHERVGLDSEVSGHDGERSATGRERKSSMDMENRLTPVSRGEGGGGDN